MSLFRVSVGFGAMAMAVSIATVPAIAKKGNTQDHYSQIVRISNYLDEIRKARKRAEAELEKMVDLERSRENRSAKLRAKLRAASADIEALERWDDKKTAQLRRARKEIDALKSQVADQDQRMATMATSAAMLTKQRGMVADLRKQLKFRDGREADLLDQVDLLKKQRRKQAGRGGQIAALKDRIAELESANDDGTQRLQRARKRIGSLEERVDRLKANRGKGGPRRGAIARLEAQHRQDLDQANAEIARLEEQVAQLRRRRQRIRRQRQRQDNSN